MANTVVRGRRGSAAAERRVATPDQVKARLMKTALERIPSQTTATDVSSGVGLPITQDLFALGAGAVDASAALANTDSGFPERGRRKSARRRNNSSTNTVSIVGDPATIWITPCCGAFRGLGQLDSLGKFMCGAIPGLG